MKPAGTHILLDMKGIDRALLDDRARLRRTLVKAAKDAGARVLDARFRSFEPSGVTGVVLLAESHIAIHTWPDRGYAAVDLFTCGRQEKAQKAARALVAALGPTDSNVVVVTRTEPGGPDSAGGAPRAAAQRIDDAIAGARPRGRR
ncbi:MAG: adenosylmethionine decarboxylase [Deltaproteobacteria bacterium]|nr:adenosylmethionine decarboxylase [Deltaproteobacteria bacterium]